MLGNPEGRPVLLVLRALGLGDFLTGVPALRALADAFPDHHRVLAAPRVLSPLVALTGAVDEVLDAAPLQPLDVPAGTAESGVNLHGSGPQSHRVLLGVRPRRLISFCNPEVPESASGPLWRSGEHEVHRWCRLLGAYGIRADPTRLDLPPPPGAPEEARGATLIHPGAASAARRWSVERWAAVARYEAASGRRVVITGGPDEIELAHTIARIAGLEKSAVYAGRTSLLQLAAMVAAAGRVVCGDTGVAHLATAFRTPSVVLFGPVPPDEWGPPPERSWHRALWVGRKGNPHAGEPDPGLLEIRTEDVLEALEELPERVPRQRIGASREEL